MAKLFYYITTAAIRRTNEIFFGNDRSSASSDVQIELVPEKEKAYYKVPLLPQQLSVIVVDINRIAFVDLLTRFRWVFLVTFGLITAAFAIKALLVSAVCIVATVVVVVKWS